MLLRFLTCAILLLPGCAGVFSAGNVERSFVSMFKCTDSSTSSEGDGYRVEGCGKIAHYECLRIPGEVEHRSVKPGGGRILANALVDGLFSSMTASEECRLAYVEPPENTQAAATVAEVEALPAYEGLRLRLLLQGGRLTLLAKPKQHPRHLLIAVRSSQLLPAPPCEATLFDDGVPIAIEKRTRSSRYEELLLVRADALNGVQDSLRFAGNLCGFSFELGEAEKRSAARFSIRVAEELERERARTAQR